MLDRLFGITVHPFLQLMGMIVLSVGLPLNKVLMSIGTIWLASNIILKADFNQYLKRWKKSKIAWFVIGILFLHLIGLAYTSDFSYAFRDLNTKLPFFAIPLAIIAFPVRKEWINYVLYFFIASLCVTSMINMFVHWSDPQSDFRSMSLFGSHIRYTILVVAGILVCLYLFRKVKRLWPLWFIIGTWFLFYVYQSQVFAGYVSVLMLTIACFVFLIIQIRRKLLKNLILISLLGILISGAALIIQYFDIEQNDFNFTNLPKYTESGNEYLHDTSFVWYENGNHVMSYISVKELRESWNKRSQIDYDSSDVNGHKIQSTLVRYMTSKGLHKDHGGMEKMTDEDIQNVELGYTNINQLAGSPLTRLENLKNDILLYRQTNDPNGNSITERIEHFQTGKMIVADHWLIGVGTGDVQRSFDEYYEKKNTKLEKDRWNRAHNQFLTFWITFGVFGFLIFIGLWFYLAYRGLKMKTLFVIGFTFIAVGSFLSEDTIETQQGVTFIAFFLALSYQNLRLKEDCLK